MADLGFFRKVPALIGRAQCVVDCSLKSMRLHSGFDVEMIDSWLVEGDEADPALKLSMASDLLNILC